MRNRTPILLLLASAALAGTARADSSGPPPPSGPECTTVSKCTTGCNSGNLDNCTTLAGAYDSGDGGLVKDHDKAMGLYIKACNGGRVYACDRAATALYEQASSDRDKKDLDASRRHFAESAAIYQKACSAGLGRACCELAYMYKLGDGVKKDMTHAMKLYVGGHKLADEWCRKGDPQACFFMANEHDLAIGELKKDTVKGAQYFEKACTLDGHWGCDSLAGKYENGDGVEPDPAKAKKYYQRACDAGETYACNKAKGTGDDTLKHR